MQRAITITVNGVPKGKARPRFRMGQARPFTPRQTRDQETDLGWAARRAMAGHAIFIGPVFVDASFTLPIPASWSQRKRDAALSGRFLPTVKPDYDNAAKLFSDAFNKIVWKDDSQVTDARIRKRYGALPGVVVTVRSLELGDA